MKYRKKCIYPLTYKVRFIALIFTKLIHRPSQQLSCIEFHEYPTNGLVADTTSHRDGQGAGRQADAWQWPPDKAFSFSLRTKLKNNFLTSYYNGDM